MFTIILLAALETSMMSIIQTALLSGGIIYLIVKHYLDQKTKEFTHRTNVEGKITDSDIQEKKEFQQEIVYKSFDAYVEQNNKVMHMFTNQIDKLEEQMRSLDKTQLSNFAQGDVIRREIQSLKNSTTGDLNQIKGLLINFKNLNENTKIIAELLNTAVQSEMELTKIIKYNKNIIENKK